MMMLNKTLDRALSVKRPHDAPATVKFSRWLADNLPIHLSGTFDACGNLHVDARADDTSKTLFVAHVDTVHRKSGKNRIKKTRTHWYADGDMLGADDGAGCAMLMHLIHSEVPAYYVFTVGEEKGGIGATWLAKHKPDLLKQFDRAIAFDRRGIDSVITHQSYGRCCSDDFGSALCDALGAIDDNLMHLADDTGIYTDTAEFTDLIPECTNISIGYSNEHTVNESLNIAYFNLLAAAAARISWDDLPVVRDPRDPDPDDWRRYKASHHGSYYPTSYSTDYDSQRDYLASALVDFHYGYTGDLIDLIAEYAYPDDPAAMARHLNPRKLDYRMADDLLLDIEMGDISVDEALLLLADEMYTDL
jgi:hypothetical protein